MLLSLAEAIVLPRRRVQLAKVADLFCGAGSLSMGVNDAMIELGIRPHFTAVNHWDIATQTFARNHPGATVHCVSLNAARRLDDDAGSTGLVPEIARPFLEHLLDYRSNMTPGRVISNPAPKQVIVCTATIGEPKLSVDAMPKWKAFLNDSDRLEHSKWAWPMLDVEPTEPIKSRGGQGFFWVTI